MLKEVGKKKEFVLLGSKNVLRKLRMNLVKSGVMRIVILSFGFVVLKNQQEK